ncbi:MAG: Jag N-terminal domain-containing protein [Oscillospiraceae bacterium]|jgi:spoIIIJ-associated protein|nr:Jag N-terminal domain-containing protein [Oscillospiraceae bacterium]
MREAVATGATVEEAKESAVVQLAAKLTSNVEFEILDLGQKKTLGIFGGTPAKVRAYTNDESDPSEVSEKSAVTEKPKKFPLKKPEPPKTAPKAEKQDNPEKTEKSEERRAPLSGDSAAVIDRGKAYLRSVLDAMDLKGVPIEVKPSEEGCELQIGGENVGAIIGHRGETLDALQHLVSLAANRGENGYCRFTLNTGHYREKREQTLEALARRMANQAVRTGRNQALEPMNPYERRLIHSAVQNMEEVSSWSVGENNNRRVIIGTVKGEGSAFRARDDQKPREPLERRDLRQGGRGGDGRDRGYDRDRNGIRRERPAPYVPQGEPRESRRDAGELPLYGKIEK